jgi:hypothetical protein
MAVAFRAVCAALIKERVGMCHINWTAIWTGILAFVAMGSFWLQWHFSRKQLRETHESFEKSLEAQREVSRNQIATHLYLQMTERFDSARMHEMRKILALNFLANASDETIQEDVMNFFEDLGALLKKGRLDEELAYNAFSYHAIAWWAICRPYVRRQRDRDKDSTLFREFEAFAARMAVLDAAERRVDPSKVDPDEAQQKEFLREEQRIA